MSFTYNSIQVFHPVGCIIAGLFTTEPNGWILADGITRNNTDGIYNELINLSIGTGTLNINYTPPNLKGAFLRGADASFNLKTFYNHKTQTHTHTATQQQHSHTNNTVTTEERTTNSNVGLGGQNGTNTRGEGASTNPDDFDLTRLASLTLDSSTPNITINNTTINVDNNESRPFNYGVNWYIKY